MAKRYPFDARYTAGVSRIYFGELCGHIELAITGAGTGGAIELIDGLLGASGLNTSVKAEDLVIADRDRLLAAIYNTIYGSKIESTVECPYCAAPVDTDFDLTALHEHIYGNNTIAGIEKAEDNCFAIAGGYRFRLPTGADELALAWYDRDKAIDLLLEKCLLNKPAGHNGELVQKAMEQVAPILESDLQVLCAECGKERTVHFCIQSFLLSKLMLEQKQVIREIHNIAASYRWGYQDIMSLPRSLRRRYNALIES